MQKREFLFQLLKLLWGSSLTKLGSSLAIIGAIALTGSLFEIVIAAAFSAQGKPSPIPPIPTWIGLLILASGIGLAVLGTYWPQPMKVTGPNPHDIELLRRFRSQFTEVRKDFLRDHDFWGSFRRDALDFVTEVGNWRGARFEFVDAELNALFEIVKERARQLDELSAMKTWPHRVVPHLQTALPDNHDEWDPNPQVVQAVKELNSASKALIEAADAFERVAIVRVMVPAADGR